MLILEIVVPKWLITPQMYHAMQKSFSRSQYINKYKIHNNINLSLSIFINQETKRKAYISTVFHLVRNFSVTQIHDQIIKIINYIIRENIC